VRLRMQHQGELATQALVVGVQPGRQCVAGQRVDLLELLGELAPDGQWSRSQRRQGLREIGDAMR